MKINRLTPIVIGVSIALLAACGGSDPAANVAPAATEVASPSVSPSTSPSDPTPAVESESTPETGATAPAATTAPNPPSGGELADRFCVDFVKVETTLNLRASPSTDAEILASIPRASCELVASGAELEDNFRPVIYTTTAGTLNGWVSNNFITSQNPPTRIEAAALLFVDAWQAGGETTQYSYDVGDLPAPIGVGSPVPIEGQAGFGCVLEGDVTVVCAIALVEDDGTEVARLELFGSQRGTNGYDGEPYFAPDFPDGPTITGFSILDT